MINYDNKNNQMSFNCDGHQCTTMQIFDGDFKYCISEAKAAGWKFVKTYSGGLHYCCEECKAGVIK